MAGEARIERLVEAALPLVTAAGAIALRFFRTPLAVENKQAAGAFDPVTEADRQIEAALRHGLAPLDAGLGIVGEEYGATGPRDSYWIIDPIDGTRAFMSGMLGWGILLGLVIGGRAVAGIVHQPFTGELFVGSPAGAWLLHNGSRSALRSRAGATLADAILYSTDPAPLAAGGLTAPFARLAAQCRLQRWGGDCYAFAMLARGCIDLVVEGPLAPYDIVPLIAIIEQSGGVVTDLAGSSPLAGGAVIAAATPALHAVALRTLTT